VSEHQIQSAFFGWAELQRKRIPNIEMMFAVPNGGVRHKATAGRLKGEGVKAGVPDVLWPVPRGGYIGLAIEFKSGEGNPTAEQRRRIDGLQKEGWNAVLCWSWESAARVVVGYAGLGKIDF
jgi:hypothetical protein